MPDKKSHGFLFGLTTGIAITALLGFLATTIASSFKTEKSQAEPSQVANSNNNTIKDDEPVKPAKVDFEIKDTDHIRGDKNAAITIMEYSDFQCSYCAKFNTTLNKALEEYKGKIKVIYRHFPLDFHPYAEKAAQASECANDQNKFWEYADEIYKNQASFSDDYFKKAAKDIKLDTNKFNKCLDSEKYKDKVAADAEEGAGYGVSGTPGSFLNGEELGGAIPYEQLKAEIDKLLK
jgi:protein-disulfide isomerase